MRKYQFGFPAAGRGVAEKSKRSQGRAKVKPSKYSAGSRPPRNISVSDLTSLNSAPRRSKQRSNPSPPIRRLSPEQSVMCPVPQKVNPDPSILLSIGAEDTCTNADLVFQLISKARPSFSCREAMFLHATRLGICRAINSSAFRDWDYKRPLRAILQVITAPSFFRLTFCSMLAYHFCIPLVSHLYYCRNLSS